ncbi:MAG: hypothetical protein IT495_19210 [Gammaproteobacteria bacterium]|nr:hypothetical protein [Gammaproteobacteria bacterium]
MRNVSLLVAVLVLVCGCGGPGQYPAAGAGSAAGDLSRAGRDFVNMDDGALCASFRGEWVSNYVRAIYDQQRSSGDLPATARPFEDRMAGSNPGLWAEVAARGLDQFKCRVPQCFTRPHVGWWEPHCGYRVPNAEGKALYGWVPWRAGVEPPALEAMQALKQVELENNKRQRTCGDNRGSLC